MNKTVKEALDIEDAKTRSSIDRSFKKGDDITISIIQRRCRTGYFTACRVLVKLQIDGLVSQTKKAINGSYTIL